MFGEIIASLGVSRDTFGEIIARLYVCGFRDALRNH